ncbi:hypothetical protein LCGC14_2888640 [marine sediment metagenome]|uniref:Uncharacterized protein n=1 Tax=marine sediment metagenome TaxID=412755 RepID=A0A0F9AP29_9ZZZZ
MTDYVLKGSEIMKDFEPCDRPNCSWCDPKGALVKVCAVDESAGGETSPGVKSVPCAFCGKTGITYPHYCDNLGHPIDEPVDYDPSVKELPETPPNRFEPYEALDTIIERVDDIEEQLHEPRDPVACIGRLADISGEVRALRAYITGMER